MASTRIGAVWSDASRCIGQSTTSRFRGDRQNGRREALDWCRCNGVRYVFGLPVNAALDPQDLRQDHAWEQRLSVQLILDNQESLDLLAMRQVALPCAPTELPNVAG